MHKRQYANAGTPHAVPIFRTLGIPSGFILALCAVLNPSMVSPTVSAETQPEV